MTRFTCADTPGAPLHEQRSAAVALAAPSSACNSAALLAGEVTGDQVVRPCLPEALPSRKPPRPWASLP